MGLIKHFFVLNSRGNPLVLRGFLVEATQEIVETFYQRLMENPPPSPVFHIDTLTYVYVVCSGLYFVVTTSESMSPTLLVFLLRRITAVITDYIGRCTEVMIQKNLALVYEVVDEVLSFGCPQSTDTANLLHLIHNEVDLDQSFLSEFIQTELFPGEGYDRPLALPANQRTKTNNEVFVVLNEKLSMTLSTTNQLISNTVTGVCFVKSYLQGMPSISFQLDPQCFFMSRNMPKNLALKYDDITFAPYASVNSFDSDRTITFNPPEGTSLLFTYRTTRNVNPPFVITTVFESVHNKVVVVRVSVQSTFAANLHGADFILRFQCPVEISNASCELPSSVSETQSSEFDSKLRQVNWKINKFPGLSEYSSRFRFIFDEGIPTSAEKLLGPIALDFSIGGLLPSGLSIKNFLVSTQGTPNSPHRWYKETTSSNGYTFNFL